MKKLLLFLALCSGVAGAMKSDAMQADVASIKPVTQDQLYLTATTVDQPLELTPEEQKQAVTQAAKNVQEIVDACGNAKELLKAKLMQRIGDIACVIKNTGAHFMTHCELDFYITVLYGINFIQPKLLLWLDEMKSWEQQLIENSRHMLSGDDKQDNQLDKN
ncbi:MAG: hypothetical protein V1646_02570 [bacterium]